MISCRAAPVGVSWSRSSSGVRSQDLPPGAALGPEVDQVVSGLDELEVAFDDEDGMPLSTSRCSHQPPHASAEPRRGLVQQEQGLALGALREWVTSLMR